MAALCLHDVYSSTGNAAGGCGRNAQQTQEENSFKEKGTVETQTVEQDDEKSAVTEKKKQTRQMKKIIMPDVWQRKSPGRLTEIVTEETEEPETTIVTEETEEPETKVVTEETEETETKNVTEEPEQAETENVTEETESTEEILKGHYQVMRSAVSTGYRNW